MSNLSKGKTEILIVGAGPTGLTMACELLRRGIPCRVIDKADAPAQTSRALGLLSRTLEVFQDMGIVEQVLARGLKVTGGNIYEGDKLILHLDLQDPRAPCPYALILPQSGTEQFLTELLHRLGGAVERSRELVDFRQERDTVVAFVRDAGGEAGVVEEIRASWLIGCDGAHSRVRKTLGLPFEGSTYEEEFLLADVDLDWSRSRDETHMWLHRDGPFGAFPLPGDRRWRLIAGIAAEEGEEVPQASLELFQRLLVKRTGDSRTTLGNPTWMSNFRIHRRIVTEYRQGRVFLAGDAAHIHSPLGGQGMNTGIQDAYNLAWKLALVIEGKAAPTLLDTYQEERLPVARRVLQATHTATNLLVSKNPALRFVRDHLLIQLLNLEVVQEVLLREASELSVNYRTSALSRSYEGTLSEKTLLPDRRDEKASLKDWLDFRAAPRAGDRAPQGRCQRYPSRSETSLFEEFRGTKSILLLFDGLAQTKEGYEDLVDIARRVEALLGEMVKSYIIVAGSDKPEFLDWDGPILLDPERELHTLYGAGAQSLYFIRPDGYIGFRSQPIEEEQLLDYLGKLFLL